jgi:hypothetical protein
MAELTKASDAVPAISNFNMVASDVPKLECLTGCSRKAQLEMACSFDTRLFFDEMLQK